MDAMEILSKALKLEQESREFYLRAAQKSDDEETKQMFRQLAEDELNHYNFLQRQYASLICDDTWCAIPELDKVEPIDLKEPIFPSGKKAVENLAEGATIEDALLFALTTEDKSFRLYQKSAEEAEDPQAKQLFQKLAAAETTHFERLMHRYESFYGYPR
jgi:rubrerythrin